MWKSAPTTAAVGNQISSTNISVGNAANTSSGVWSRPSIDLSAFAGQSVQIAFHFTSGGSVMAATLAGMWTMWPWSPMRRSSTTRKGLKRVSAIGRWMQEHGKSAAPTERPQARITRHGTNCAATVLAGDYGRNVDTRLISPPFPVPSSGNPALRFWQWYNFVNALGFVEIRSWHQCLADHFADQH